MIITCLGHAEFLLELDSGLRIVTDPYDASCGFPMPRVQADAVLVSHGHHDHCAVEQVSGYTQVIDTPGVHTIAPGVRVTAIPAWHDEVQGEKRGANLLFLLEAEGLRIAHLGDLGHLPQAEQIAALAPLDAVMLPVGGFYTIDASTAAQTAQLLQARIILPMHYRTQYNADWPITPVDDFLLQYLPGETSTQPLLRITKDDMMCHKHVVVLTPQAASMQA